MVICCADSTAQLPIDLRQHSPLNLYFSSIRKGYLYNWVVSSVNFVLVVNKILRQMFRDKNSKVNLNTTKILILNLF